mmetsp:Transcript_32800/g.109502  ORF Transcript_32800/g.109502 Transcript_32800/m.109502 type:complete len:242 (-) Transcript_32800:155-880(-)
MPRTPLRRLRRAPPRAARRQQQARASRSRSSPAAPPPALARRYRAAARCASAESARSCRRQSHRALGFQRRKGAQDGVEPERLHEPLLILLHYNDVLQGELRALMFGCACSPTARPHRDQSPLHEVLVLSTVGAKQTQRVTELVGDDGVGEAYLALRPLRRGERAPEDLPLELEQVVDIVKVVGHRLRLVAVPRGCERALEEEHMPAPPVAEDAGDVGREPQRVDTLLQLDGLQPEVRHAR